MKNSLSSKTPTDFNSEILDFKEACAFLKFKPSRLYSEVFRKRIPHIKLGSSLRFSKIELEHWLFKNSVKGSSNE